MHGWLRVSARARDWLIASLAVRSVENRMLDDMTQDEQSGAFKVLQNMIDSLHDDDEDA